MHIKLKIALFSIVILEALRVVIDALLQYE